MKGSRGSHPEPEERSATHHRGGLVRWLFDPVRRRFFLPASGLWILGLDWLLFSSNLLSGWLATPVVMVAGFVLGGVGVFLAQRRAAKDGYGRAAVKALVAGIAVGLPWPIGGTLLGGWVLLTSGLADARKGMLGK